MKSKMKNCVRHALYVEPAKLQGWGIETDAIWHFVYVCEQDEV